MLPLLWVFSGCEAKQEALRPVHRFVDPALREGAAVSPATLVTRGTRAYARKGSAASKPVAEIGDDTRPVLATHPKGPLVLGEPVRIRRRGVVSVRLPLRSVPDGRRVVLVAHVRQKNRWTVLDPVVINSSEWTKSRAMFRFPSADKITRGKARVNVVLITPPGKARTSYRTKAVRVPEQGRLRFSLGILEPAARQGAVRFSVSACQKADCTEIFEETVDPAQPGLPPWLDRRVSIQDLAGKSRSFLFVTEHLDRARDGFTLPVWGDPTIHAPRGTSPRVPNVLLISIDTLRRDHLGLHGYERATSPFVDEVLAAKSTVFDNLIAAATTTGPSHMTMFTSVPASVHGVIGELNTIQVPIPTLAEVLRAAGFETAAFTENGALAAGLGFGRGFNRYMENKTPIAMLPEGQIGLTFDQGREWLTRLENRPFFLFLHTYQVHGPYEPPEAYEGLFADDDAESAGSEGAEQMADYDREIRYVDDQLRSFFHWLTQKGITKDTIILLTSDHGEQFFEHGHLGHATLPHEEVLGVPLLVSGPGIAKGRRVNEPVTHFDFAPTILELVGLDFPSHLQGRSLVPLLTSSSFGNGAPGKPIISEGWTLPDPLLAPAFAARIGSSKLILYRDRRGDHYELYDLSSDPFERQNLFRPTEPAAEMLRAVLDAYQSETARIRGMLQAGADTDQTVTPEVLLDPRREEQLRMLGYIE